MNQYVIVINMHNFLILRNANRKRYKKNDDLIPHTLFTYLTLPHVVNKTFELKIYLLSNNAPNDTFQHA